MVGAVFLLILTFHRQNLQSVTLTIVTRILRQISNNSYHCLLLNSLDTRSDITRVPGTRGPTIITAAPPTAVMDSLTPREEIQEEDKGGEENREEEGDSSKRKLTYALPASPDDKTPEEKGGEEKVTQEERTRKITTGSSLKSSPASSTTITTATTATPTAATSNTTSTTTGSLRRSNIDNEIGKNPDRHLQQQEPKARSSGVVYSPPYSEHVTHPQSQPPHHHTQSHATAPPSYEFSARNRFFSTVAHLGSSSIEKAQAVVAANATTTTTATTSTATTSTATVPTTTATKTTVNALTPNGPDYVIVTLLELCLDPYYRTLEGFCVLLDKEWVSYGYTNYLRLSPDFE